MIKTRNNKGSRFYLLPLFFLLILVSSVYGAPPFITEVLSPNQGYTIVYPPITYIEKYQDINLEFYVYNTTSGFPKYSGISCDLHLYNTVGQTITEMRQGAASTTYDYSFIIGGNNFTTLGSYSYIVNCNNSEVGGFVASTLIVTDNLNLLPEETGDQLTRFFNLFVYIVLTLLILILLFFMHYFKEDRGAPFIYGMIGAVISFITAGLTMTDFKIVKGVTLFIDINYYFTLIYIALGVYLFVIGFYFYQDYSDKKYKENNPYG